MQSSRGQQHGRRSEPFFEFPNKKNGPDPMQWGRRRTLFHVWGVELLHLGSDSSRSFPPRASLSWFARRISQPSRPHIHSIDPSFDSAYNRIFLPNIVSANPLDSNFELRTSFSCKQGGRDLTFASWHLVQALRILGGFMAELACYLGLCFNGPCDDGALPYSQPFQSGTVFCVLIA